MKLELEIIKLINRLLEIPMGEQLYRGEIKLLFDILRLHKEPIVVGGGFELAMTKKPFFVDKPKRIK